MSEEKEYPSYNINVGVPTEIESLIKIKTFKYHPYGLENFRKDLIEHIDEWQSRGLSWRGFDQLTHAWRTPWDTHVRYEKLMSPIIATVMAITKELGDSESQWFLKDCWISDYTQNSGANKHNHGIDSLGWSFCYYVKMPDSGPGFTLCDGVKNENYQMNVAEGDLLIFRHPLDHQVFPTIDRRIIISGNIVLNNTFTDSLMFEKFYDEDYDKKNEILKAKHHDVNVDDWGSNIFDQKLALDCHSGGY